MRYLITILTIATFSIALNSAAAQTAHTDLEFNITPQQFPTVRQALEQNIINHLIKSSESNSEFNLLETDIDSRMDIDQRYFQNRFKILSNETPILYKLYT